MANDNSSRAAGASGGPGAGRPGDSLLQSIGKAIVAPIEGAHQGLFTANHAAPPPQPPKRERPDTLPDGRDGRVAGKSDNNVLESIGKAIIAPVVGAEEGAGRPGGAPPRGRPK